MNWDQMGTRPGDGNSAAVSRIAECLVTEPRIRNSLAFTQLGQWLETKATRCATAGPNIPCYLQPSFVKVIIIA